MKKTFLILFVTLLLTSCKKEYDLAMKSADKDLIMRVADKYYEKKKWKEAIALYERLPNLVAGTDLLPTVTYKSAYANYYDKNYKLAGHQFKNFSVTYPQDPRKEEAAYMAALCYYEGSLDYNLDQENTKSAINELQEFVSQYPNSEKSKNINQLIDELSYKIEFKAFENARQYYKIGEYKAADVTFQNVLDDFPASKLKPKIINYLMKSKSQLAMNSIYDLKKDRLNTAINYTKFVEKEFPNSDNSKDAVKLRADLENEKEKFSVLEKQVEEKKSEFEAKQKALAAKNQEKKMDYQEKTEKKILQDSARINTPKPGASFKIPRKN